MDGRVRTATTWDAGAIARIHLASWRITYDGILPSGYLRSLSPGSLERRWRRALARRASQKIIVADVAGRIGGFASFGAAREEDDPGFVGELFMLYVDPEMEGAGIGSRLIESATEELARSKFLWMVVWLVKSNRRARLFYARHGFAIDGGVRTDTIGGGKTPTLRMAKPIGSVIELPLR